jgi:hydroxyethylthiazole kinase-like uncharacterized protein yjeF
VGGSAETPGAVILAGTAALRAGAGRLQICTDPAVAAHVAVAMPEARVMAWDGPGPVGHVRGDGGASETPEAGLASAAGRADAVVLGPGILEDERASALLHVVVRHLGPTTALLLDSAALRACVDEHLPAALADRAALMPNLAEAASMLAADRGAVERDPGAALDGLVAEHGCVVSLRDAETLTAAPAGPGSGRRYAERSGVPALATSGSGDVLAGIAGGLLARGADPLTALLWANHLHALAGRRGGAVAGIGMLARELLDHLAALLGDLEGQARHLASPSDPVG